MKWEERVEEKTQGWPIEKIECDIVSRSRVFCEILMDETESQIVQPFLHYIDKSLSPSNKIVSSWRDKITATALSKCIAHLVNHQIAHEILSLQLLTILLEGESDLSI